MGRERKALPQRRGERSGEPQAHDEGEAQAWIGRGGDRVAVLPCPTQNGETRGRAVAGRIRANASVRAELDAATIVYTLQRPEIFGVSPNGRFVCVG